MPFKQINDKLTDPVTNQEFTLIEAPTNKNAGKCLWAVAKSNKTPGEIFIKQYLSPKAPSSMASPEENDRRQKECDIFKNQKIEIFNKIKSHDHLLTPIAFFQEKSSFFAAYPLKRSQPTEELLDTLSYDDKLKVILQITSAVSYFQQNNMIHSDIKPTNLIITTSPLNTYLIDYDSAYFVENAPKELEGDFVYRSPEMIKYNSLDTPEEYKKMTLKSDIFSLGVLFYRILSGKAPTVNSESNYVAQALLDGKSYDITLHPSLDNRFNALIKEMVSLEPSNRPNIKDIHDRLVKIISGIKNLANEYYTSILNKIKTIDIPKSKQWESFWTLNDTSYEIKTLTEEDKKALNEIVSICALTSEEKKALSDFDIKHDESYNRSRSTGTVKNVSSQVKMNIKQKPRW